MARKEALTTINRRLDDLYKCLEISAASPRVSVENFYLNHRNLDNKGGNGEKPSRIKILTISSDYHYFFSIQHNVFS
uniref:Uncharacterized protein n=1 Tax=Heliothis virescens TaxID=7102 RepID=A0A2A4J2S2_HELVI